MFGKVEERRQEFYEKIRYYEKEWGEMKDALHKKKLKALSDLKTKPRVADEAMGMEDWKYLILNLKVEQVAKADAVHEIDEILLLPKKHRNTYRLPIHSPYWLVEEECLFWSNESFKQPLSHEAHERFMTCFSQLCKKYQIDNPLQAS